MAKPIDALFSFITRRKPAPTETLGAPGTAIYGGYVQEHEKNANLGSKHERHKVYSEILANASIVSAGVRYFLNLIAKAEWSFNPSEADTEGTFAKLVEAALTDDMDTPWHRVVRRAGMYRFYGFSIQEWTARRHEKGHLTFQDVAPRAQLTIEKWDSDITGKINGVIQRSPQTAQEIYLPRNKLLYMVDDTLSDSPEGLGLFRHLVEPAQRLFRYQQLEGTGFETDLRGIPVGRGPFTELARMTEAGDISKAQRIAIEAPLRDFVENHIKTAKLGMLLDSMTYESKDEAGKASNIPQWSIELMKGGSTSFAENAAAIERLNRELARILGVESLMLGSDSTGSLALSKDKTNSFFLLVDGSLTEIRETITKDLVDVLWLLNGWPDEMKPNITIEAIRHTDAEAVTASLRDLSTAGVPLDARDPVVDEIRDLMGVEARPQELLDELQDAHEMNLAMSQATLEGMQQVVLPGPGETPLDPKAPKTKGEEDEIPDKKSDKDKGKK